MGGDESSLDVDRPAAGQISREPEPDLHEEIIVVESEEENL